MYRQYYNEWLPNQGQDYDHNGLSQWERTAALDRQRREQEDALAQQRWQQHLDERQKEDEALRQMERDRRHLQQQHDRKQYKQQYHHPSRQMNVPSTPPPDGFIPSFPQPQMYYHYQSAPTPPPPPPRVPEYEYTEIPQPQLYHRYQPPTSPPPPPRVPEYAEIPQYLDHRYNSTPTPPPPRVPEYAEIPYRYKPAPTPSPAPARVPEYTETPHRYKPAPTPSPAPARVPEYTEIPHRYKPAPSPSPAPTPSPAPARVPEYAEIPQFIDHRYIPSPVPPPPPPKYTEKHDEAASTIQNQFRVHQSLRTLDSLSAEFDTLREDFHCPTTISFQNPYSPASGDTVDIPAIDIDQLSFLPETDDDDNVKVPKLAYKAINQGLNSYTDSLDKFLVKLDGVESWEDQQVRIRRRNIVKQVEMEHARVDRLCKETWIMYVVAGRQRQRNS